MKSGVICYKDSVICYKDTDKKKKRGQIARTGNARTQGHKSPPKHSDKQKKRETKTNRLQGEGAHAMGLLNATGGADPPPAPAEPPAAASAPAAAISAGMRALAEAGGSLVVQRRQTLEVRSCLHGT